MHGAGVAIGPFALGLVGEEGQDVLHYAEFGVEHVFRDKPDSSLKLGVEDLEELLRGDLADQGEMRDSGWDPESLRQGYGGRGSAEAADKKGAADSPLGSVDGSGRKRRRQDHREPDQQ